MKALLIALLAVGLVVTPAMAQAPATSSAPAGSAQPLTPAQKQAEKAAAQALLKKVISSGSTSPPAPDLFTNRSAALMGFVMFIPLSMIDSFASMGSPADKAGAKEMDGEIAALGKKYGLDSNAKNSNNQAEIASLESHGRQFYADVTTLFVKMATEMPDKGSPNSPGDTAPSSQFPRNIADYSFTAVSPTEVKITTTNPASPPMKAVLEDGLWRLDFGGLSDLTKTMSQSNMTPPATTNIQPTPPVSGMKAPDRLFFSQPSASAETSDKITLEFSDGYKWLVKDKIITFHDGITENGRKMGAALGIKADYFHILHTDLVAIRPHDKGYPRQDTIDDAIMADDPARVADLIAANPGLVNGPDSMGAPLISAVFFGHEDIVKLLLRHGARVNQPDNVGDTALMDAAEFDKVDEAKLLLAAGAKVDLKDNFGRTALAMARENHHVGMVALLLAHGAR